MKRTLPALALLSVLALAACNGATPAPFDDTMMDSSSSDMMMDDSMSSDAMMDSSSSDMMDSSSSDMMDDSSSAMMDSSASIEAMMQVEMQ